jgi:hypothetical protein
MRRDLERRLQAVEAARIGTSIVEVWIEMADGMMRNPRGEMISRDEFELRSSGVVPLPLEAVETARAGAKAGEVWISRATASCAARGARRSPATR